MSSIYWVYSNTVEGWKIDLVQFIDSFHPTWSIVQSEINSIYKSEMEDLDVFIPPYQLSACLRVCVFVLLRKSFFYQLTNFDLKTDAMLPRYFKYNCWRCARNLHRGSGYQFLPCLFVYCVWNAIFTRLKPNFESRPNSNISWYTRVWTN